MNCRWNEEKVFPSPMVAKVLEEHYVEARLHTDGPRGEELSAFEQKVAGSIASPLYLIVDPKSEQRLGGPLGGITSASSFREFLLGARDREEKVGRLDAR